MPDDRTVYPPEWAALRRRVLDTKEAVSPLQLAQEMVATPFQACLAALIHVRTTRAQGHPTLWRLLGAYPNEHLILAAPKSGPNSLEAYLRPAGLAGKRAAQFQEFALAWVKGERPYRPDQITGCGEYVSSSYRIFTLGDLRTVCEDAELTKYAVWAHAEKRSERGWRAPAAFPNERF